MATGKEVFLELAGELVRQRRAQLTTNAEQLRNFRETQQKVVFSGKASPLIEVAMDSHYQDGVRVLLEMNHRLGGFPTELEKLLDTHQLGNIILDTEKSSAVVGISPSIEVIDPQNTVLHAQDVARETQPDGDDVQEVFIEPPPFEEATGLFARDEKRPEITEKAVSSGLDRQEPPVRRRFEERPAELVVFAGAVPQVLFPLTNTSLPVILSGESVDVVGAEVAEPVVLGVPENLVAIKSGIPGLEIPWGIDFQTGRVFPRLNMSNLKGRPPKDLGIRQEGLAYAFIARRPHTNEFVYPDLRSAVADIYADLIAQGSTYVEKTQKLNSTIGGAAQAFPGIIEKLGKEDVNSAVSPHLAAFRMWVLTQPEYATTFTQVYARILRREITFGELLELANTVELRGASAPAALEAQGGNEILSQESDRFIFGPTERYFLASILEDDRSHTAARQALGIEGDETLALPPRDREQLNDIITRVSEQNLAPETTTYEDFIAGIAARLTFYQEHKAQVIKALEGKDPDLLFILSFFPTQQRIPLAALFHQMAAAVLPNVHGNGLAFSVDIQNRDILSADSAREGSLEPLPDLDSQGQRNLASRAVEILRDSGVSILRSPTIDSMMKTAYAFVLNAYAGRGHAQDGVDQAYRFLQHDLPIVADLIVRGRHADPSQRPHNLGIILGIIESSWTLSSLDDKTLVDVIYRRDEGLCVLQNKGIVVDPNRGETRIRIDPSIVDLYPSPVDIRNMVSIPTDTLVDLLQVDIRPWEVYVVATILEQLGISDLHKLGLSINEGAFRDIIKAREKSASSKGQLRNPGALAETFSKLVAISRKGLATPFTSRSVYTSFLADVFDGVSSETIKEVLAHELQVSFAGGAKN